MSTMHASPAPSAGAHGYGTTLSYCSCPDMFYRSRHNPEHRCKHQKALRAQGACSCVRCGDTYLFGESFMERLYCPSCRTPERAPERAPLDRMYDWQEQDRLAIEAEYYDAVNSSLLAIE